MVMEERPSAGSPPDDERPLGVRVVSALATVGASGFVLFATFLPLDAGTVPSGCGMQQAMAMQVTAKVIAHACAIGALAVLLTSRFRTDRPSYLGIVASVAAFAAAVSAFHGYFIAGFGLSHAIRECGEPWNDAAVLALFWASPAIAMLLDLATTQLLRSRWPRRWSIVWSCLVLGAQACAAWSLTVGTY